MENKKSESILDRRNFLKLGLLTTTAAIATSCSINAQEQKAAETTNSGGLKTPLKQYMAKDFASLKGTLRGISDEQLDAHLTLYKKYISKINTVEGKLSAYNVSDTSSYRPLQTAQTYMLNGAVLHELYFGNLGATDKEPTGNLKKMIDRDYGSTENFIGHLKAAGTVMKGWSIAAYNFRTGKLNVYGMDQHNDLVPTMVYPILALDVYEHAYMIDYGINRGKYLDTFVANLNWRPVQDRLELALSIPFGDLTTA